MQNIHLESQINALYHKAHQRKQEAAISHQDPGTPSFGNSLKQTIESMSAIYDQAENALKSLSSADKQQGLHSEIAEAGYIHKRIMEAQHHLASLYEKLNQQNPVTPQGKRTHLKEIA